MHTNAADNTKWPQEVICSPERWAQTNHFNDGIRPTAFRHLLDPLQHALLVLRKVEWLSTQLLGEIQSTLDTVHSKEMLGTVLKRRNHSTQSNRSATNNDNSSLASGQRLHHLKRILGAKEPGGEDIGHQNQRIVRDLRRSLVDSPIGERHADVLGLAAVKLLAPEEEGVGAARGKAVFAIEALAARDGEGGHDLVANLDSLDGAADGGHVARELVTHDEARGRLLVASKDMQLAAAEGRCGYLDDDVCWVDD